MNQTQKEEKTIKMDDKNFEQSQSGESNDFSTTFPTDIGTTATEGTTEGVSQIFRDSLFNAESQKKTYVIVSVSILAILIAGLYFIFRKPQETKEIENPTLFNKNDDQLFDQKPLEKNSISSLEQMDKEPKEEVENDLSLQDSTEKSDSSPKTDPFHDSASATPEYLEKTDSTQTSISLLSPANGEQIEYNELINGGYTSFQWDGISSGKLLISPLSDMSVVYRQIPINGTHLDLKLYPKNQGHSDSWYWQIISESENSEKFSFTILPARKRTISLISISNGAVIEIGKTPISWEGDEQISYYRIELVKEETEGNLSWGSPYRFATKNNTLLINTIPQGAYQLRLGAHSRVAGKWEYIEPIRVTLK